MVCLNSKIYCAYNENNDMLKRAKKKVQTEILAIFWKNTRVYYKQKNLRRLLIVDFV